MVLPHTPEPVGVGSPNPLGKETSPLRWMSHLGFLMPLAPEGRYVYSRATPNIPKAPEGRHVRFVSITNYTDSTD